VFVKVWVITVELLTQDWSTWPREFVVTWHEENRLVDVFVTVFPPVREMLAYNVSNCCDPFVVDESKDAANVVDVVGETLSGSEDVPDWCDPLAVDELKDAANVVDVACETLLDSEDALSVAVFANPRPAAM
jgi:hypothetical protein